MKGCKTWFGTVRFVNHVVGWECDVYAYFRENDDASEAWPQTVLIRDGEEFPIYKADAVAIVPRGSDFIHYDPRFTTNVDKWVAEGSKLGFASKLDVRPGCAYGNTNSTNRAVGDAARPTGGKTYNSFSGEYTIQKERLEKSTEDAEKKRTEDKMERIKEEMQAVRNASEKGSKEMKNLEEKESNRLEKEKSKLADSIADTTHPEMSDNDSRMVVGTPVYVRDAQFSWVPATIESPQDEKQRIKVRITLPPDWEECTIIPQSKSSLITDTERIVKLTDYPNNELPLQNVFAANVTVGKNDMADLTNLHEAAILYNLKARHKESNPYTRVGDIMVALNPFQVSSTRHDAHRGYRC